MNSIFLLALIVSSYSLVISSNTCKTVTCQDKLADYFIRVNSRTDCEYKNDIFTIKVSHNLPDASASGFKADAYTLNKVNSARYLVTDFKRVDEGSKFYLHINLNSDEIKTNKGCVYISDDKDYYTRQCYTVIEYVSLAFGGIVKEYFNLLTVRIPKTTEVEHVIGAVPIRENGCDCVIDAKLTYETKLFMQDCTTVITNSATLAYNSTVCLFIRGTDSISKEYSFDLRSLTITYRDSTQSQVTLDMTGLAIVRCDVSGGCT